MSAVTISTAQSQWRLQSSQLISEIAKLVAELSQCDDEILVKDLNKLQQSTSRLADFIEQIAPDSEPQRLAHDFRNIVGAVLGYTELIQECAHIPDVRYNQQLLETIIAQALELLDLQLTNSPENEVAVTTQLTSSPALSGTVLIVDDQQESREILQRGLSRQDLNLIQAATAEELWMQLKQQTIDLILLDLILGDADGLDLLKQIKASPQWRVIPVIVISGHKDTQRVIHCIEAGAEDYLFKPFNAVLLQARIRSSLQRKQWHDLERQYQQELERNQRFIRNVFGRYLSTEIVDTLLENPDGLDLGGSQRRVTVMMADIRGFTSIAEKLPPHRVVKLLNNYLGAMSDIIIDFNGTVDEFIGDAILAIFGAPISRDDDTDRAIYCALRMQQAMQAINAQNVQQGLPEIQIGISLNTGLVIAGNIGSEKRAKYGVVGHTVNQTARIEEHCGAGKVLISESTLLHASSFLSVANQQLIAAKGIVKKLSVYELADVSPKLRHKYQALSDENNPVS